MARDQGALAGRNMVQPAQPQDAVPWFWSDQFDRQLQVAGLPERGRMVVDREMDEDARLLFYLSADGTVVGAAAYGQMRHIGKDMRIAQRLIAQAARPDAAALAAADQRLKSLLVA